MTDITTQDVGKKERAWGVIEKVQPPAKSTTTTRPVEFEAFRLFMKDDGTFPNNSDHPVLFFPSAFTKSRALGEEAICQDGWTSPWAWGIFPYHHYHSTAWELLLCVQGSANIQLGGEEGPQLVVKTGDILLVPPGFAHKQLSASGGFTLLGSYPPNSGRVDTLTGPPTDQERKNIVDCLVPLRDPLTNTDIEDLY